MVLESTMICVDDSDYMRNGDFGPTRIAQEQDAVHKIATSKIRFNPQNNVGLLTLASLQILTTLTSHRDKLMSKMLGVEPRGNLKIISGIRTAHLALKHRLGKNYKMRIVLFVGSPLTGIDEAEFIRLAKRLKKERVNVDVISFGECKVNENILRSFVDAVNGKDGTGSNLVLVPDGKSLQDAIMQSPMLQSVEETGEVGYVYGVDPNDDPELALALRISMEEQRGREEADPRSGQVNPEGLTDDSSIEEQMLAQALAMSLAEAQAKEEDMDVDDS